MIFEVNKPLDTTPNVRCYKCKTEFYVHPMADINAPWIKDCKLHKPKCKHESDGMVYTSYPPQNKCRKCGEFYR